MPTPAISALSEKPSTVIMVNFGGRFFKASQNTYAALLDTQARLTREHPKCWLRVIQSCYNVGVAASAGTHDYDACLDVQVMGMSWADGQVFLRKCGWAAWWRHTGSWASPSQWHIHMALLGAPAAGCTVGTFVDGGVSRFGHAIASSQYADYLAHPARSGLAGHVVDPTWHPADIPSTIFKYTPWLEDNMPLSDKDVKRIADAVTPQVVSALLNATVGPDSDKTPVRTALYRASNVPDLIRAKTKAAVDQVVGKLTDKS